MLLAQGRLWHVSLAKDSKTVVVGLHRESLPEDSKELKDFRVEVPLEKWTRVVKQVRCDRKLLGGVLLDFATQKDNLASVLANDRLFGELQSVLLDASTALVEMGELLLTPAQAGGEA